MQSNNYQWVGDRPRSTRSWLTVGAVVLIVLWTLNWSAQGAQLSLRRPDRAVDAELERPRRPTQPPSS